MECYNLSEPGKRSYTRWIQVVQDTANTQEPDVDPQMSVILNRDISQNTEFEGVQIQKDDMTIFTS